MTAATRRLRALLAGPGRHRRDRGAAGRGAVAAHHPGRPAAARPAGPTSTPPNDRTVGVPDTYLVTALAVVIWIAWAQLAVAIVVELAAALRRRPGVACRCCPAPSRSPPAWSPPSCCSSPPSPSPGRCSPPNRSTSPSPPPPRPPSTTGPTPPATRRPTGHRRPHRHGHHRRARLVVGARRTPPRRRAALARDPRPQPRPHPDRRHHDPARHRPARTRLGSCSSPPPTRPPTPPVHTRIESRSRASLPLRWEVERGDHFWGIAETTLAQAWGRPPTDAEIVGYWRTLIDVNRDRLAPPGDPDLIHPGQRFVLPAPPPDPNADRAPAPNGRAPGRTRARPSPTGVRPGRPRRDGRHPAEPAPPDPRP
jgi:hypothetical protein